MKYHPALGEPEAWCAAALNPQSSFAAIAGDYRRFSPYGAPGHARDDGAGAHLYVKEACCPHYFDDGRPGYRADWNRVRMRGIAPEPKWKRPLYMRRSESRITLEIVSVRVERVQDISEEDARAEGVPRDTEPCDHVRQSCADIGCMGRTHRASFASIWEAINGKRAPWTVNPFVWVLGFRRVP